MGIRIRSVVTQINSPDQFKTAVDTESLVVAYYTAAWCPPCKAIAPVFEKLSDDHGEAVFLKIDVDEQQWLAAKASIAAMPTFQFLKGGEKVKEVVGADPSAVESAIVELK